MPKQKKNPVKQLLDLQTGQTDPQGSWTGQPWDEDELPVQDADDL